MAKGKGGGRPAVVKGPNSNRKNGKAWKKFIWQLVPVQKQNGETRHRLKRVPNPNKTY